jgi:glycosyltransferase involved in cell wall biosynthesis
MTSLSSILRSRRSGGPDDLKKVVFVSYGTFDCNSAGHIAGFARELSRAGLLAAVCAREPVERAYAFGPPAFEFFSLKDLMADPAAVVGFDGTLDAASTLLIGWTPRKAARRALSRAAACTGAPYIVHFEDNEDHLAELRAAEAGEAGEQALREDRAERRRLMAGALGATVIEPRLKESLPQGLPTLVLEPGVDLEALAAPLPPHRRSSLLKAAGAPAGAAVIVYPGNIHRANAGEMAELYKAVRRLRDAGRDLVLIKTGKDDVQMADRLGADPGAAGVLDLGLVERPFLLELIKCADLFVQPGAPGPFNDFRLPSKLPEFMAVGRPIILPRTNVGLRLRDGADALLLDSGSAEEIAARVEILLDHPEASARMARGAQAFARKTYVWSRQGEKLLGFLRGLKARAG